MKFSQRINKTPIKTALQTESMDDDLRNGLWNLFDLYFLRRFSSSQYDEGVAFFEILYLHHLKTPIDSIPGIYAHRHETIRRWFFKWKWYEVYDFIEFVAKVDRFDLKIDTSEFVDICNHILERELSGYRFVDKQIVPITDPNELKEIQKAIQNSSNTKLTSVREHLASALSMLSDKKNPDYRNSIKESISAVEAILRVISGDSRATFGQALKVIEDEVGIHPALKKGFSAIYGYTSDADGIRHALTEESKCDFEDAKYMLVSCSAFINYMLIKAAKAGIHF